MDTLDRQLIHALGIDGRASFRTLGTVLGASEQTIARRYARLRSAGIANVVALPRPAADDLGQQLRLHVQPGSADRLAKALSGRGDVAWVRLAAAGTEVICGVRAQTRAVRDTLVLEQIPKTGRVTSLTVHDFLHIFRAPGHADWEGFPDALDDDQRRALLPERDDLPYELDDLDRRIIAGLADDGRRSAAQIAADLGEPEPTMRRRIDVLLRTGAMRLDLDLDPAALGYPVTANLYLDVEPKRLHAAGETLATHAATMFVAAATGTWNLCAAVACRDISDLYTYTTETLAEVPGIRSIESSITSSHVKRARTLAKTDSRP